MNTTPDRPMPTFSKEQREAAIMKLKLLEVDWQRVGALAREGREALEAGEYGERIDEKILEFLDGATDNMNSLCELFGIEGIEKEPLA